MQRSTLLRYLLILVAVGAPALFLIWKTAQIGVVYTFSESEIWGAQRQAENLLAVSPTKTFFLTDEASSPDEVAGEDRIYTHNPWALPRLGALLTICLGIKSWFLKNLLICLGLYATYVFLLSRLLDFRCALAILFLLVLHLDFFGFLRPMVNMGRAWCFPLFFLCVLAILGRFKYPFLAAFGSFFLLWQYEFLFAVFGTASCAAICAIQWFTGAPSSVLWKRIAFGAGMGMVVSISLFLTQLLLYFGAQGLWNDFTTTMVLRNSTKMENQPSSFDQIVANYGNRNREWRLPQNTFQLLRHAAGLLIAHYQWPLIVLGLIGLATALWTAGSRKRAQLVEIPDGIHRNTAEILSLLLLGSLCGFMVCCCLLRGQTYMIALYHFHPMLVFIVAPAVTLGAQTLLRIPMVGFQRVPHFTLAPRFVLPVLLLALVFGRSIAMYKTYPPLNGEPFLLLTHEEFRGKQIFYATGWLDDGERTCMLVENATGVYPKCCHKLDRLLDDQNSCEYVLYVRHWFWSPNLQLSVADFEALFTPRGYTRVATGPNYVLMKLANPQAYERPTAPASF
jgi:hypothetical protein